MIIATIIAVLEMSPLFAMASFGQLLSQRSGVYNLGIEGIMASGAVFGILGAYLGLNSWLSLLLGFAVGVVFGALLSLLSVRLKLNQIVVGLGLWLLGLGLAGSLFTASLAPEGIFVEPFDAVLFSLDPIFYLSIGLF
ncbi:MAG: hypothetical protein ACE5PO_00720, partial [Candidatus Bathyarchaeia archaeon]